MSQVLDNPLVGKIFDVLGVIVLEVVRLGSLRLGGGGGDGSQSVVQHNCTIDKASDQRSAL